MDPRISIITLGVKDLKKSTHFYQEGLGLPKKDAGDEISFFETSSTMLALYPLEKFSEEIGQPVTQTIQPTFTIAHNVASKKKVNSLLKVAENAGAKLLKPAQDVFWGGYSGYFADLDGYFWEIAWNPHFKLD